MALGLTVLYRQYRCRLYQLLFSDRSIQVIERQRILKPVWMVCGLKFVFYDLRCSAICRAVFPHAQGPAKTKHSSYERILRRLGRCVVSCAQRSRSRARGDDSQRLNSLRLAYRSNSISEILNLVCEKVLAMLFSIRSSIGDGFRPLIFFCIKKVILYFPS